MYPNVKYELLELERILSSDREQMGLFTLQPVDVEVERIKKTFIHEVFSFEDERHLERYIQYHQQALIQLMDRAAATLQSNNSAFRQFYENYYNALVRITKISGETLYKVFRPGCQSAEWLYRANATRC